uniref:ADAM metallopeptidase domain 28 n=1 Tax=Oncorhynchus mykiss TaxID=8022 RepID=A0A8C7QKJ6_ONCMY
HGPLEGVRDYEVVRPIRLHTLRKRETEVHLSPVLPSCTGAVLLELLTKDYSETYYTEDGTPVTSTPQDMDHCYYHGSIVDDSESMVSMSTCDGLSGYFRTAAQRYLIEPLSGGDDGDHAVLKYEDQSSKPMLCGVTNSTWNEDYPSITSRSPMHRDRVSVVLVCTLKHIASIPFQYKKMESNRGELRKRIFEVVNFVNMVYKPLNTFIALVGLEVWSDSDKISVTAPAGATLDAFTTWRNNDLVKTKPHDNAHLISGIDFEGSTVGLAFIGTLCSGHSAGVVQDHNPRAIAVGATLAHEMGHNLGMNHDDSSACACSGNSCVMAGALSWDIPKSFSSCSSLSYDQFLNNRNPECLLNKPDYRNVESTPVCGNGFLERGEECDCGSLEIMASSTECRRKHDDCDLAEYCTGNSAVCPEDVFSVNGISCDRGRGYCRNGQCPQHHDQCVKMYGPSAEKATTYCYNQNTRGLYYAYCRRPSQDQFIPCQSQDVQCGKLFCKNGNDDPNYGRMVKFSDCKATFYGDHTSDFGQVNTGTKCNDGKVCSKNECVDLETAYGPKATNCSARCKGHAVSTAPPVSGLVFVSSGRNTANKKHRPLTNVLHLIRFEARFSRPHQLRLLFVISAWTSLLQVFLGCAFFLVKKPN